MLQSQQYDLFWLRMSSHCASRAPTFYCIVRTVFNGQGPKIGVRTEGLRRIRRLRDS